MSRAISTHYEDYKAFTKELHDVEEEEDMTHMVKH